MYVILSVCFTLRVVEVDLCATTYKHSTAGSLEGNSNQSWQIVYCAWICIMLKCRLLTKFEDTQLTKSCSALQVTVQEDANMPIRTFSPHAVKLAYLYWRI